MMKKKTSPQTSSHQNPRIKRVNFFRHHLTRQNVFVAILTTLGTLALTYGSILLAGRSLLELNFSDFVNFCVYLVVLFLINRALFRHLDLRPSNHNQKLPPQPFRYKQFFITWGVIFLCWVPIFLAYYPGIWAYDAPTQLHYNLTDHPLIHTAFLRFCIFIGECVHNYNIGIAVHSLLQMLMLSCIFAFTICKLTTWRVSSRICKLLVLFFAILPFNSILAISATKDVLFSGFMLLSIILLYDLFYNLSLTKSFKLKQHKLLIISLVLTLTMFILLRKNALYVAAIWLIFTVIFLPKPGKKYLFGVTASAIILALGTQAILTQVYQATTMFKHEALAVPMQNLTVVASNHPDLVPESGTHALMFDIIDRDLFPEEISQTISPTLVDPVKLCYQASDVSTKQLLSAWLKYGVQYPLEYLDSWATLTASAWSPLDNSYANIYGGDAVGYLETNFIQHEEIGDAHQNSKFPWLKSVLDYALRENHYADNPLTFLLLSPALYTWLLVFCLAYAWYRRARPQALIMLMPFLLFGTVLLGPCILVRYMYPLMITAPVFLILTFNPSSVSIFPPLPPRSDS